MKLEHRDNCVLVKYIPNRAEASGQFDSDNGKIYVNIKLSLLERECVYLHEVSHKECYLKKCKCWEGKEYWCEYHAMKGELQKVIARGSLRLNRAYMKNVNRALDRYRANTKLWKPQLVAIGLLMKTKMFKKLKRSIE